MAAEQITVATATKNYLERLHDQGLLEGESGNRQLNADVNSVLTALHHVLAGGQVTIKLGAGAATTVVSELEQLRQAALLEHSQLEGEGPPLRIFY